MMGRQDRDQRQLFYEFNLDEMIPADHLLRRINVFATAVLADLHEQLMAFYSDLGRPSVDPELMIRMLLVGYCYGIRHERRLCQEVALHLAYRWFCKLDLDDKVPHHSTFSVNRLGRFRESEMLRHIFERVLLATSLMTRSGTSMSVPMAGPWIADVWVFPAPGADVANRMLWNVVPPNVCFCPDCVAKVPKRLATDFPLRDEPSDNRRSI